MIRDPRRAEGKLYKLPHIFPFWPCDGANSYRGIGALSTGGGLVFLALFDGTVAAFDDTTLEELCKQGATDGRWAERFRLPGPNSRAATGRYD
jgi:hypothetical protein